VSIIQHFIHFTRLEEMNLLDHSDTHTEHRTSNCIYNS